MENNKHNIYKNIGNFTIKHPTINSYYLTPSTKSAKQENKKTHN